MHKQLLPLTTLILCCLLFVGMSVCSNLQKDHLKIKLKITGISGIQVSMFVHETQMELLCIIYRMVGYFQGT